MPSAKQLIEGRRAIGVIHFEVLVMQVVHISVGIDGAVIADFDLVKSDMPYHGTRSGDLQVVEE